MIAIRQERHNDHDAREALLDRAYGPDRFTKCSQQLREDRLPAAGLSFVATDKGARCQAEWEPVGGPDSAHPIEAARSDAKPVSTFADRAAIIGSVRLWNVSAGPGRAALLLGPLAVAPEHRSKGIGGKLMKHAIAAARMRGHGAILLVGDAPYYGRFGFSSEKTGLLWMPGHYDPNRLLALELSAGALDGARGLIGATGRPEPKPDLRALVAAAEGAVKDSASRAA